MKEALRAGHRHEGGDLSAAPGLTEYCHVVRIAAKCRNVSADPLKNRNDVEHSDICRIREFLAADSRKIQIAVNVQAMIVIDYNHIVVARQTFTIVRE